MDLNKYIAIREDWPKKGISFKDITPLLQDKDAFKYAIDKMTEPFINKGISKVVCADARGFLFGSVIAYKLGCAVVAARKPGKLPFVGRSETYSLEYGTNTLEIAPNSVYPDDKVLIVDDLLATGGSAKALTNMVKHIGAEIVGYSFVIELDGLKGKEALEKAPIYSLLHYEF